MEPNENNETSTTYLTTGRAWVAPAGTSVDDLKPEDWIELGGIAAQRFETFSSALDDLGESISEAAKKINESFSMSVTFHNVSVDSLAIMFGMSKMEVRRLKGYIPSKPLFHNGKKSR